MSATISMQELFDRCVKHARSMTSKATKVWYTSQNRPQHACRYRGDNGAMCIVGSLITDEVYAKYACDPDDHDRGWSNSLEGEGVTHDKVAEAVNLSLGFELTMEQLEILEAFQTIHDESFECMEEEFEALAKNYGLVYTKKEA